MEDPKIRDVCFTPRQLNLVAQALDEAEKCTTRYYCIPPFRWQRLSYDVVTSADAAWKPLPESALAEVLCLHRNVREPSDGHEDEFYRIQLNDAGILTTFQRDRVSYRLFPFLIYILTHEMIHLVRLSSILGHSRFATMQCRAEEARVRRITRQVLTGSGLEGLGPVLDRFCVHLSPPSRNPIPGGSPLMAPVV